MTINTNTVNEISTSKGVANLSTGECWWIEETATSKYVVSHSNPTVSTQPHSKWPSGVANGSTGECFLIEESIN